VGRDRPLTLLSLLPIYELNLVSIKDKITLTFSFEATGRVVRQCNTLLDAR